MIEKARANAERRGFNNVEFREGDIEKMPVGGNSVDVVVSNCVLNLVPHKQGVFSEIFRVLKPGGHFSISDVVLVGVLPPNIKNAAEMYSGCVSGATQKDLYLKYIDEAGFTHVTVQKEKTIPLPDEELAKYLNAEEIAAYKQNPDVIRSITVYAEKPSGCGCGSSCCC
jgi:ubiquinone/menaquinone biosynthesis C-methylase UbiE